MKWTQEMRGKLYSRLVKDFGSYNAWGAKTEPKDNKIQFHKVLTELTMQFSKEAGHFIIASAVHTQIDWAYDFTEGNENSIAHPQFYFEQGGSTGCGLYFHI